MKEIRIQVSMSNCFDIMSSIISHIVKAEKADLGLRFRLNRICFSRNFCHNSYFPVLFVVHVLRSDKPCRSTASKRFQSRGVNTEVLRSRAVRNRKLRKHLSIFGLCFLDPIMVTHTVLVPSRKCLH